MTIQATYKRNKNAYQGLDTYNAVLIVDDKIKHVCNVALCSKADAIKHAQAWRNESLACGYITK